VSTQCPVARAAPRSGGLSRTVGVSGIWCLGFIGALVYCLHTHSGTFWLVVLAFLKALVWPAFVVYHVLQLPT
jgi:hypothetical protein